MPAFDFVLAGRYRLIAPLGEGGMAAVYRARDLRLAREVAIKILHDDLTRDPGFLARFQREAQFVAQLSHPNIVSVFDVGEDNGTHFIVMEYVRGRTLKELIERDGRLDQHRAVAIAQPILEALGHAHSQGFVHRDVKPQNVLLMPDGTPRLADFGIAHLADGSATRTAAILGSAHYLSPEQSRGEDATAQSDVYASGVMLFEMLAGYPPFDGPNALAIANHHLHTPPPSLRDVVDDLDDTLAETVHRALAKESGQRFPDTQAFAHALESDKTIVARTAVQPLLSRNTAPIERLEGAGPAKKPVAPPSLIIRRSTRKWFLLALFLVAILIVSMSLATLSYQGYQLPQYPSAPYLLFPAVLFAVALLTWIQTRSWIYSMNGDSAIVQWGWLSHHRFGIPLRQIATLELKQSPLDRVLGVGTVELYARDAQGQERRLVMQDVPHPREAYEDLMQLLSRALHSQR